MPPSDLSNASSPRPKPAERLARLKRSPPTAPALPAPDPCQPRVVFYGDSITDGLGPLAALGFLPGSPTSTAASAARPPANARPLPAGRRPISTPPAVLILAGTNDIAGNTGPSTPQMIEDNFISMTDIARASGIKVILASITPAYNYPWKPGVDPVPTIRELNAWLKDYCAKQGLTYVDYYSAMSDEKGAMKPGLAKDGVHPTAQGYAIMGPLAEAAIAQALQ